jgi:hypothetical protein
MKLIATRTYPLDSFTATDRLFRVSRNKFVLTYSTDGHPQEPERRAIITELQAIRWCNEAPEGIVFAAEAKGANVISMQAHMGRIIGALKIATRL